jgi:hypothetical protein
MVITIRRKIMPTYEVIIEQSITHVVKVELDEFDESRLENTALEEVKGICEYSDGFFEVVNWKELDNE